MKILILSTFFPPAKLTPSERIYSWAKYFKKYGLYPIIVTRIWPDDIKGYDSSLRNAGTDVIIKKNEDYEVHYLPYENDLNEKLALKWGNGKWHFLYRIVLMINMFLEPVLLFKTAPFYKKLLAYSTQIIKKEGLSKVFISGAPFMLFKVGYRLKKRFPSLSAYADYRDDWTTSDICFNPNNRKSLEIVRAYLMRYEKKWLSVYKLFFTVSDNYVDKIQKLIKIPGYVAENGFMSDNYQNDEVKLNPTFTISYVGFIYGTQPIEIFIDALKVLVLQEKLEIKVNFIGLKDQDVQLNRIRERAKGIESCMTYTARLSKEECILLQQQSHLLLQVGHQGIKGSPGSKMYEYLALKKPVLVAPSDGDIVERTLSASGQGYFANDVNDCCQRIKEVYDLYQQGAKFQFNNDFINTFDREFISKRIVEIINNH